MRRFLQTCLALTAAALLWVGYQILPSERITNPEDPECVERLEMARRHLREAVPASDIVQRPDVIASVEELRLKHREEFSCLPDSHHAEFDAEVET
ncbi:MAG: hypothetical protein AAFR17_17685 [Pseudomonadota bacterium]